MGRMNRLWLVLLVTLALVASGVTVAMAEGLTQEIPQIFGFGEGGDDVSDEPVVADVEGEEEEPGEPGDGSEAATEEEEGAEEPAGDEATGGEPLVDEALVEPYLIEGDGFRIEVSESILTLTIGDGDPLEIPMDRVNNHGAFVSALAKAAPKGEGHGAIIRAMAQSMLGKDGTFGSLTAEGDEDAAELGEDDDSDEAPELSATSKKNGKAKPLRASKSQKSGKKSGMK
jgi:hypothetical protein